MSAFLAFALHPHGAMKHILVATDFSAPSRAALEYAAELAKACGASITLLHTYEIPAYSFPDVAVPVPPDMERAIAKAATRSLHDACEPFAKTNVKLDVLVTRGKPWVEIERVADEKNADMIVLGTHARGPLGRVFLGSVAEKVVRVSRRAVLVVPSRE